MALIGNRSILHKSPGRFLAGTVASGDRSNFSKHGMSRNAFQVFSPLSSIPQGARAPVSWIMAKTAGGLSSHNESTPTLSAAGLAWAGFPIEGSSSIAFTVADMVGELISSGQGSASFSITTNNPLLTAVLNAIGSAGIILTGDSSLLGAIASSEASASIVLSVVADILPEDDTPPARTATATFTITAEIVPYAIGNMIGSTESGGAMTEATIAARVWDTVAAEFDNPGTMGEKLNGAGSAGNPWTEVIEGALTASEVMRLLLSVQAGVSVITDNGDGTATVVFKGQSGENRVTATMDKSQRTTVTLEA